MNKSSIDFDKTVYNLLDIMKEYKIICFTSSQNLSKEIDDLCKKIIEKLSDMQITYINIDSKNSFDKKQYENNVFINLPSVNIEPKSILVSKECDCVIFVEKIGTTHFKDFEQCLYTFKQYNANIQGVITI